jgi:hypothetical protein
MQWHEEEIFSIFSSAAATCIYFLTGGEQQRPS